MNISATQTNGYVKVWFSSERNGRTAGIVLHTAQLRQLGMVGVSTLYPSRECVKMERFHVSEPYFSERDALLHDMKDSHETTTFRN